MKNAAKKIQDSLPRLRGAFALLTTKDVLVGVPKDETARKDGEMNNATLAYIHDNGAPASNIPARPFMKPGIESVKGKIVENHKTMAKRALKGDTDAINRGMTRTGLMAQSAIRKAINDGVPPPLKESTLKARIRAKTAVKGAKAELASRQGGGIAGMANAKPLVATGQLRNSINFVVRKKTRGAA